MARNTKLQSKDWKINKKVVDKLQKQWYDIKVAAENETTAKNLDNWTVKQPWKILKSFNIQGTDLINSKRDELARR